MKKGLPAGLASATIAATLLFLWFQVERWLAWRSGYTDLPGQNTLRLIDGVQPYALGVIALVAGRIAGLLCPAKRWFPATLSVLPLLLLVAVSPRAFRFWYVVGPLLALFGAYGPGWIVLRRRTRFGPGELNNGAEGPEQKALFRGV